ncbi:MAG: glycosyltransferase [Dehalococcoidia bacterium]
MRILHIIQNLNYGGMERLLSDLVRGIGEPYESHVLVLEYLGRFAEGLETSATLHHAPEMSRLSMLHPRALTRVIRSIAPDVVHTHSGVWYKATLAAKRAGVAKVIHTEHGRQVPDPLHARVIDRLAARNTDVVVGVSGSVTEALRDKIVKGRCRVQSILNGVDTNRFRPATDTGRLRGELGLSIHAPLIGSIGRLEPIKGYGIMIDAFAILKQRANVPSDTVLVIAGDGSQGPALRQQIIDLGLSTHIRVLGWRDDVEDLLSALSVFTMSSFSEGTSISLLEAMSCGLCPVVTAVGGNPAVLGTPLRHRLVPPQDAEALAVAWEDALLDSERRADDGQTSRARVREAYSAERMIADYRILYAS